jgi:protein-S-isoprenylcysteine O-methyltransferase Ste14
MKHPGRLIEVLGYIWAAFGVYWVGAGFKSKQAQTQELPAYRLLRLGILVIVFSLLFWPRTASGILGRRFVPDFPAIAYAGFAAALIGLAIATWARIHLGQYWSDQVVIKVEHRLIRTGPYVYMRHPIYSGVLLCVLGTAFVIGEWRGLLAFFLLLTNYAIKARKEEQILAERFTEDFHEHTSQAGFLLPRFRPRT